MTTGKRLMIKAFIANDSLVAAAEGRSPDGSMTTTHHLTREEGIEAAKRAMIEGMEPGTEATLTACLGPPHCLRDDPPPDVQAACTRCEVIVLSMPTRAV